MTRRRREQHAHAARLATTLRDHHIAALEADLDLPGATPPAPIVVTNRDLDLIRKHAPHLAPSWTRTRRPTPPDGVTIRIQGTCSGGPK